MSLHPDGGRPGDSNRNRPASDPEEAFNPQKGNAGWPLWVSLLRGGFFMIAMVFTYGALVMLNYDKGPTFNIITLAILSLATFIMAVMGLMRCNWFERILVVLICLIFMMVTWFEYGDDLYRLKNPETGIRNVTLKDVGKYRDAKAFYFDDTRFANEFGHAETYENSGSYYVVAPYVSTKRDTILGDSVTAFLCAYSYDGYDTAFTSVVEEWTRDCVVAQPKTESYEFETYANAINNWKERYGRASSVKPMLFELTTYPYLNKGQEVKWLITAFVVVFIGWIVLVSIERVVVNAIRGA